MKWQWASLVNYTCEHTVDYVVFFSEKDAATKAMLEQCIQLEPADVYLRPISIPPHQLFRRAIGRNIRALATDASVIWFTDIDYMFGPDCLDTVCKLVSPEDKLCMPEKYWINIDHETGDKMLDDYRHLKLPLIPRQLFMERKQKIAIGGLQILGGDTAREIGYLNKTKYQDPVPEHFGFRSCKCDSAFRRYNDLKPTRMNIPNLYRIRHTEAGRSYLASGQKGKGKEAW